MDSTLVIHSGPPRAVTRTVGRALRRSGCARGLLSVLVAFALGIAQGASAQETWRTDFTNRTVDLKEIVSGGPPKDGIPALDEPEFVSVRDAGRWLDKREPVAVVTVEGEVRVYPLQILIWHEIVNDEVGGTPVVVLWGDPATADALDGASIPDSRGVGTGVAYRSTVDDTVLTFDTHPDGDLFIDRETNSVWTLFGKAISGPLEGTQLEVALHRNEFFFAFAAFFPDADLHAVSAP